MRRALTPVALLALLVAAPAAADRLTDALWDLHVVPLEGQAPPSAFRLPDLAGRAVALAQLRGRAVLLYFWATT